METRQTRSVGVREKMIQRGESEVDVRKRKRKSKADGGLRRWANDTNVYCPIMTNQTSITLHERSATLVLPKHQGCETIDRLLSQYRSFVITRVKACFGQPTKLSMGGNKISRCYAVCIYLLELLITTCFFYHYLQVEPLIQVEEVLSR